MPYYRLYHLDGSRLVGSKEFYAADDDLAVRDARLLNRTATFELWEGGRKIAPSSAKKKVASQRDAHSPTVENDLRNRRL